VFQDDKTAFINTELKASIAIHKSFLGVRTPDDVKTYTVPVRISLLPRYPATVEGVEMTSTSQLDPTDYTKDFTFPIQAGQASSGHPWQLTETESFANDEYVQGADYLPSPGVGDRFSYMLRFRGTAPDFQVQGDGHQIVLYRKVDYNGAFTYRVHYRKQTTARTSNAIPLQKVAYGEAAVVDLSDNNKDGNYQLTFKLASGQVEKIDNTMSATADNITSRYSSGSSGNHIRVSFVINQP
jgi:hypothetical protein